jgi:hypothetical protein
VRREGHVSTSRPPKSHVVDRHPSAEPPEGHTPTALCEIPPRSSCTTNAVIANLVIPNDLPRHPERSTPSPQAFRTVILNLFQNLMSNHSVVQSRFYPYVCNCRARMFASEVTTQHNGLPSSDSKRHQGDRIHSLTQDLASDPVLAEALFTQARKDVNHRGWAGS